MINGYCIMKKIIMSFLILFGYIISNISISAQGTEYNAPTVQYKLNNHDSISLKWNNIEGADAYYVFRTNTETGKKVRYTKPTSDTEITINNLSANTEYVFNIAPIKKKGNKVTVGRLSSGTKLTTPKEWYYYDASKVDTKNKRIESNFYRTDYAKTKKEKIYLGDIKAVDEIIYYDGWYYVIGYCDGIESKPFPWGEENNQMCVARIREDGTQKEILFDDFYKAHDTIHHNI